MAVAVAEGVAVEAAETAAVAEGVAIEAAETAAVAEGVAVEATETAAAAEKAASILCCLVEFYSKYEHHGNDIIRRT